MKKLIILVVLSIGLGSCTDNSSAKNWGGTEAMELQQNHKLLNVTWKGDNMWLLTQDTTTGTCYFKEKSSWGVLEGTIIIR
jgi:hypothetical protein